MKLALAGVGGAFVSKGYYGTRLRGWVVATLVTAGTAAIIAGGIYGITKAVRIAGAASCRTFARQSGYGSNYKIQHFLDAGTCYVHLPNGHALPENMVTGFLKAGK